MKMQSVGAAFLLLMSLSIPALAQQVTMETLLDPIQIQDLLTRYYYDLAQGKSHELSDYSTEDAMLDVDGTIAHGRDEIAKLYGGGSRKADAAGRWRTSSGPASRTRASESRRR